MQKDEKKTKNFSIFIEIFSADAYSQCRFSSDPQKNRQQNVTQICRAIKKVNGE
ncbi:hypothetical protein GCM10007086_24720 [Photobacterium aphoticum]|nr:hypothetical protein GCM10007086_24720 [Photobacterium aphoticum]